MPSLSEIALRAKKPLSPEGSPIPMPFSSPAPEKEQIKEEIAQQAGLDKAEVNDESILGAKQLLEGAQSKIEKGEDPLQATPQELKSEVTPEGEIEVEEPESAADKLDRQKKIAMVITAIVPTLAGYAFGGTAGAATGAKAGAEGVAEVAKAAKEQTEATLKSEEKAEEKKLKERELDIKAKEVGFKTVDDLRKERNQLPITKITQESGIMIQKIRNVAKSESPAGDISLIYSFMKLNDPGSVVREGEFATAQNAGGVPDRIRNMYNKLLTGERLNPKQRGDFVRQSEKLWKAQVDQQAQADKQFVELAEKRGIDPNEVITSFYSDMNQPAQAKQDENISNYANTYNLSYDQARQILINRGYKPRE